MNHFPKCRERVIPRGYELMISDDEMGVAAYIGREGTSVIAYSGRRIKPDFHHSFKCAEYAKTFVAAWQAKIQAASEVKRERREERRNAKNPLAIGDVLICSWGYEQTNIDYYEVTAMVGKKSVEICPIDDLREDTGDMTGNAVPRPGVFKGSAARYVVQPCGGIRISSFQYASRKEFVEVAGVRVFKPDSWTAYA